MTGIRDLIGSARAALPRAPLAFWASIFLSLSTFALVISLAASQAFLAAAGITYAAHLLRDRPRFSFPPVKLPLALFCLWTIVSMFWAEHPAAGGSAIRKMSLFLVWLFAVNLVTAAKHLERLYQGLFLASALAGVVAIGQFETQYRTVRALHPDQIYYYMTLTRIHGFMGHWMNFGGQQMLVFAALVAFLLLAPRAGKIWWGATAIVASSIVLNFTRGVWLGCFIAGVYLVARWRARWLWTLPVLLLAGYFAAPSLVRNRLQAFRHPSSDPSLSIRFEMWRVGLNMIRRHPWVGVGPYNIEANYPLYLPPGKVPEIGYHLHLHNNFLQLGAERGLPGLGAWVWLMGALGWHAWRIRRRLVHLRWVADAAFAGWLAFVVEGCFEFNFGTSPALMLFLFVASTPFVADQIEKVRESPGPQIRSESSGL